MKRTVIAAVVALVLSPAIAFAADCCKDCLCCKDKAAEASATHDH